ncbi:MAG: ABC transporter ATP-binding protein [Candidatus Raymondbacteria bacterium RifOxyA12_full_50_37]|uniref:ATP-binding protein Uup n=1 Tax=Candidatus Raymondbacteria bacterium RIFOXYD12_FULL_49_13 TaxID=1817890 RepID=A0A1F7F2Y7_UNCRA|nr:MAG: ABC transporter ATP-binding protein [Candidatus Raymondbacteria bacterium RifOxyB12_full_50_8]OGJ91542.1 MAG: ABC transporter ATP-binding protein [Candidatus Raymondbacteria bacterium RifOxyA12_full_50_37]OGJ94404.1 MAG: ABC transporter ATP-binding protein [Candidatus Raymondbacteria bacterium RIFOXYA2_FULL_49_16]OGJ95118.1 MAG: ABC transporter ATP-binding protein [Candidatus Raymondbacteria bacterium RIFOXYC2_FULL_50_21]OGJ97206.1 MAG: ABC transporter ATP-binding protein [Candidatus Ra
MSLVTLHNIRIAFGGPAVLDDISLTIQKGQRICLLGRNGEGKSTLLKIISRELTPDSGEVITAQGITVAYLPQEVPMGLQGSAFELTACGAGKLGESLAAYHRLFQDHSDPAMFQELQHELDTHDGWQIQTRVERVLDQVQVKPDLEFSALSGGLRRRVFLARALVREPDLLLLDEPTNHLDLDSIAWLESFILNSGLTVLFVTHDRRLLKRLSTHIIELERGRAISWPCDYPTFLTRKQAVLDIEEKEWARFDKKLAQEEVWIRRGVKARRARNEGRARALYSMREERRKRRERVGSVSMTISEANRSGVRVLEAKHISFAYQETPIIRDFSFTLMRKDRVGIIGPNGSGKTTLLNLLLGTLTPVKGSIEQGSNVAPLYFDQLREAIDPEKSVWENVAGNQGSTITVNGIARHIISYLQDFLFTSERASTPARNLSGGERHRLMLARLFTQPSNVLIFDEPTNDLDTETLELLEEVIMEYPGTILVVSHDREFLNNVVTSALIFEGEGAVREYVGGYDDWERQLKKPSIPLPPKAAVPQKAAPVPAEASGPRKLTFKERLELEALPALIEKMEQESHILCSQMADPAFFQKTGFVRETTIRIKELEKAVLSAYERWQALESRSGIKS